MLVAPARFVLVFLYPLLVACDSELPQIPVDGSLGEQRITTTVDSEIARYYLEHYLPGQRLKPQWDHEFDKLHQKYAAGLPNRGDLKKLSQTLSVDFAALFLARQILMHPENLTLQLDFNRRLRELNATLRDGSTKLIPRYSKHLILFVPAWDYKRSGEETGADFAEPRSILLGMGIQNALVEIEPTGSVEANSALIEDAILSHQKADRKIILVSASSSSPAVGHAIGERLREHQLTHVVAWLNIAGIIRGAPIIDYYKTWPRVWFLRLFLLYHGWKMKSIDSMSAMQSRARFDRLRIPEHIRIINYVGIPMSGDISERARHGYTRLRVDGPNDGATLLADGIIPQGMTLVDFGIDHYLANDPNINNKTVTLAQTVLNYLESPDKAAAQLFRFIASLHTLPRS